MATPTPPTATPRNTPAGQRLKCSECGSVIEIIEPCTCNPPDQILQCCGKDMEPSDGN
jgi:hypothetical protein